MPEKPEDKKPDHPQDGDEPKALVTQEPIVLPPEAETRLKAAGVDPADPAIRRAVLIGLAFSGPIPPPSMLAEYNAVVPGLGAQIIGWTTQQMRHRHALERMMVEGGERRLGRGQVIGGVIALGGLCLATAVGIFGSVVVGVTIAIVAIGGPTAAMVLASRGQATTQAAPLKESANHDSYPTP